MPFMSKEEIESEAERFGINLANLTWPQQQKAVMNAQMREKAQLLEDTEMMADSLNGGDNDQDLQTVQLERSVVEKVLGTENLDKLRELLSDQQTTDTASAFEQSASEPYEEKVEEDKPPEVEDKPDLMGPMRNKKVVISPEMAPTNIQLFGYDENLGDEVDVEEIHHDVRNAVNYSRDMVTGTYKVIGKTGRKVTAHTALPKEGAGITYRPDKDIVPIVTWQKREGYLWTHQRLPNIKDLLKQSGYYEQYKDQFRDEPNIWHAAGKLLCCDIGLTNHILEEITRDAKRRILDKQREDDYLEGRK